MSLPALTRRCFDSRASLGVFIAIFHLHINIYDEHLEETGRFFNLLEALPNDFIWVALPAGRLFILEDDIRVFAPGLLETALEPLILPFLMLEVDSSHFVIILADLDLLLAFLHLRQALHLGLFLVVLVVVGEVSRYLLSD